MLVLLALLAAVPVPLQALPRMPTAAPVILFQNDINEETATDFETALKMLEKSPEIVVHLNTSGGDIASAFRMLRAMTNSKATITCVVEELAASAGLLVFQGCDVRGMLRTAKLMGHQPARQFSPDVRVTVEVLERSAIELRETQKVMASLIAMRTHMKPAEYEAATCDGKELWLDAQRAFELGFADLVIP